MWSVQTQNQGFDAPDKIRAGVSMNDLRRKEIRRALALVGEANRTSGSRFLGREQCR